MSQQETCPILQTRCRVECFGRGRVHHEIISKLNLCFNNNPDSNPDPDTPCILFVYGVSRSNTDIHGGIQWAIKTRGVKPDKIRMVFLLCKVGVDTHCLGERFMPDTNQGDPIVAVVFWHDYVGWRKYSPLHPAFYCPKAIAAAKYAIF